VLVRRKTVPFHFSVIYCKQKLYNADRMKVEVGFVVCKNNQLTENTEMSARRELSWRRENCGTEYGGKDN